MPLSEIYRHGLAVTVLATAAGIACSAHGRTVTRHPVRRDGDTPLTYDIVLGRRRVPIAGVHRAADGTIRRQAAG